MNRFNTNISYILTRFWKILSLVFALAIVIFFINGSTVVDSSTLNEQAKSLEEASGKVDIDYIEKHHAVLLTGYKEITDKIAAILKPEK